MYCAKSCILALGVSPEATSKSHRTSIDPALALDKCRQRLAVPLELRGISQNARPFTPHPVIHPLWISGAKNHCRKRLGCLGDQPAVRQV